MVYRKLEKCEMPLTISILNIPTWMMAIVCFRVEIQRRLHDALLLDVEFSSKKNIEQMLWKSVFYQVIEMLRPQIAEGSDSDAKQQLMAVLDDVSAA
jgi:hypothetical protein